MDEFFGADTSITLEDSLDRVRDEDFEVWREGFNDRHGHFRPDPKPAKRLTRRAVSDAVLAERWRNEVFERDGHSCLVHGNPASCEWPPAAHHVVLAQHLRRDGHGDAVYDRRAGMTVCSLAHRQHHNRVRPILLEEIPAEVAGFLTELGYSEELARVYPSRDSVAA